MAESTKRIVNLGIIGVRGWGDVHLRDAKIVSQARMLAVCDADESAARASAGKYGIPHVFTDYHQMLELDDLDAVIIAAPHYLHHPMALAALRAGKHVLCEKPFTTSARHADELVLVAQSAGVTLACDYNLRLTCGVRGLRQLVSDGALGEVYYAKTRLMARWTNFMFSEQTNWRVSKEKAGGGILIGRGCHMMDAMLYILGHPPVRSVFASCHNRLAGFEVEDLATVTLDLDGGGTVNVEVSYVLHEPDEADQFYYAVYGTEGGACFRNPAPGGEEGGAFKAGRCDLKTGTWNDITVPSMPEPGPSCKTLLGDFVESVVSARLPLATGGQAALVTRLIESGYESARTGTAVSIA